MDGHGKIHDDTRVGCGERTNPRARASPHTFHTPSGLYSRTLTLLIIVLLSRWALHPPKQPGQPAAPPANSHLNPPQQRPMHHAPRPKPANPCNPALLSAHNHKQAQQRIRRYQWTRTIPSSATASAPSARCSQTPISHTAPRTPPTQRTLRRQTCTYEEIRARMGRRLTAQCFRTRRRILR